MNNWRIYYSTVHENVEKVFRVHLKAETKELAISLFLERNLGEIVSVFKVNESLNPYSTKGIEDGHTAINS